MALPKISRRGWLSAFLGTAAGLLAPRGWAAVPTPQQTGGPFYPTRREEGDADLTLVQGGTGRAAGEVIQVHGRVLDETGQPIPEAVVEIWQANTHGRYSHERDAGNPRPLDPNFQGWAQVTTGAQGAYSFKTIKPGAYPGNNRGWMRPPHIHFRIACRGYRELTTQMYFAGEALNADDRVRNGLSAEERERVTVVFARRGAAGDGAGLSGEFDITLERLS